MYENLVVIAERNPIQSAYKLRTQDQKAGENSHALLACLPYDKQLY